MLHVFVLVDSLVTVLAWGTWIGLAEAAGPVTPAGRTFCVTVGNAIVALVAMSAIGPSQPVFASLAGWWLPFLGGIVWAAGGFCAFAGVRNLGIARAAGIWTSLNIVTALCWGALAFHEFDAIASATVGRLVLGLAAVMAGLLIIIRSRGGDGVPAGAAPRAPGVLAAVAAGVLWGTYFVPAQASGLSPQVANVPLAVGMIVGATVMVATSGWGSLRLARPRAYGALLAAGALWGIGNLGMLALVEHIGAGRGFTIAQLGLVVNALVGIYVFKNPQPRTRAAAITLCGVFVAGAGGVLVGQSR